MEASNAGEVGKNRDSESISGSVACCQRLRPPGVIRTVETCDTAV